MFLEYWMIAVLIIASAVWGEWRFRQGKDSMTDEALELLSNAYRENFLKDIQEAAQKEYQMQRQLGSLLLLLKLKEEGMIHIAEDGTMTGYEGKSYKITDMSPDDMTKVKELQRRINEQFNVSNKNV